MCMLQRLRAYGCSFHEADFLAVEKFVLKAWRVPGGPPVLCPCLLSLSLVHVFCPCPLSMSSLLVHVGILKQPSQGGGSSSHSNNNRQGCIMGKQAGRRHPFVRPLYVWATCGKVLFFLRDDLPSANPFWKCIHTSAQTYAS